MRENITRRGRHSWRLKYDVGDDEAGKRVIVYKTVKGTRRDAEKELAKLLTELADGRYAAPTVETVETYARHWLENMAPAGRAASSVERYGSIIRAHIIPGIGDIELQKLDGRQLDKFYTHLRTNGRRHGGGLASVTLHNVHRLLSPLLSSAARAKMIARSPIEDMLTKSKPRRKPIEVLDEAGLGKLLDYLRGSGLYMPALVAAYAGLRRGEILGLRWPDIDAKAGTIEVRIGKTERSRRTIKMPASLVDALGQHRIKQAERNLALGLGKTELVFTNEVGEALDAEAFSEAFTRAVRRAGVKPIKFHGLRHTHITHLLKAGVPVHVVSARAGHARASITLDAYSHLLGGEDEAAADIADAMLRRVLK
jgi:integrase